MDRGAWQATVHGVARGRHDLATKPPSLTYYIQGGITGAIALVLI